MGIFGQAFSLIAVLYRYRSLFLMWITCGQTGFSTQLIHTLNSKLFYSQVIHNYPQFPIHKCG